MYVTYPLSYHPSLTRLSYSALFRLPSAIFRREGRTPVIQTCVCGSSPIRVDLAMLLQPIGTTMVLTPASRHLGLQVSPLISLRIPNVPPPITSCNPGIALHAISQRTGRVSDFAMRMQARRHTPPNRVRFTADRQFASSCSPPHLAATQLLSATGHWLTLTRTFTVLT